MSRNNNRKYLGNFIVASLLIPQIGSAQTFTAPDRGYEYPSLTQSSLVTVLETQSPNHKICQDYLSAMKSHLLPGGRPVKLSDNESYNRAVIYTRYPQAPYIKDAGLPDGLKYRETKLGSFIQPHEGPIFYYRSGLGSWRGNSGAIYASKTNVWADLPWEDFDESDEVLNTRERSTTLPKGFFLLDEAFVGPNYEVYWNENNDTVLRRLPPFVTAASRSEFQPLLEITPKGDALKLTSLCEPKLDTSNLNVLSYPHLSALFETLAHIVGEPIFSGTLGSSRRQVYRADGIRKSAWATPWVIGKGYNEPERAAGALEIWSYRDAWSRWKYLKLMEGYQAAKDDMYWLIVNHYDEVPDNIEGLAEQTLNRVILNHFIFASARPRYSSIFASDLDVAIAGAYDQTMDAEAFNTALKMAQDLDAESKSDVSYNVHHLITASFFSPKLIEHVMETGKGLEAKNPYGKTPLMVAAHIGNTAAVRELIARGVDISATLKTPEELLEIGGPYGGNNYMKPLPRTALDYAIENAPMDIINLLLNAGAVSAAKDMQKSRITMNPNLGIFEKEDLKIRLQHFDK